MHPYIHKKYVGHSGVICKKKVIYAFYLLLEIIGLEISEFWWQTQGNKQNFSFSFQVKFKLTHSQCIILNMNIYIYNTFIYFS